MAAVAVAAAVASRLGRSSSSQGHGPAAAAGESGLALGGDGAARGGVPVLEIRFLRPRATEVFSQVIHNINDTHGSSTLSSWLRALSSFVVSCWLQLTDSRAKQSTENYHGDN